MIDDLITIERAKLARLRATAAAWKACAKGYKQAFEFQSECTERWYRSYRRAWNLDKPPLEERAPALFWGSAVFVGVLVALAVVTKACT